MKIKVITPYGHINEPVEVEAKAVKLAPFTQFRFAIYKNVRLWRIVEVTTGCGICSQWHTQKQAKDTAIQTMTRFGADKVAETIEKTAKLNP